MNVQNIPRKDTVVKSAFVPKLDAFFFCDYPGIELKVLAWYLNALGFPKMAEVFREGADLHAETASGVFDCTVSSVSDEQRQVGKTLNFSIVYGGGIRTLLRQGVVSSFDEGHEMLTAFHAAWPGIGWARMEHGVNCPFRRDIDEKCGKKETRCVWVPANRGTMAWHITQRISERGYIVDPWGRHLHPRGAHSALNALCQGSAADLKKWAMIQIHNWAEEVKIKSHMVNEVHDEILMDAAFKELPLLAEKVPDLMTYPQLAKVVPIRPEPQVSYTTWADKEDYEPTVDL